MATPKSTTAATKTTKAPAKTAAKPAAKRTRATKRKTALPAPSHSQIAERAYFIHLDGGADDQFSNWLQAERELTAA
jgi:hypothetical protein